MIYSTTCALEMLYAAKTIYDAGLWERFSDRLTHDFDIVVGGESFTFDPEWADIYYHVAIGCVFEAVKNYYQCKQDLEIFVFWDPLMYRYNKLCREYEARHGILDIENPYVREVEQTLRIAMCLNSNSYRYRFYTGTKSPKDSKLVFIIDQDFCTEWEVPAALIELREFFVEGIKRLEAELSSKTNRKSKKSKLITLSAPEKVRRKEAA